MTLETNLSRSPYFDTFTANSGHQQVLFRPAVAVQTRELNEMQSIQQDQIDKFGRQIFIDGSVVEGCQLSFDNSYAYVKLTDQYSNGSVYGNVSEFLNLKAINSANVVATIYNVASGSVSKSPDLNTLYVKYNLSSDDGEQGTFLDDEVLNLYTASNNFVGSIVVANSSISGTSNATGHGYIVHAQEGVIFQKGFFIRSEAQSYILSKYDTNPDGVSIGYITVETIDTPEANTLLLDNAAGAPNFSAPGAHRLKLTPKLSTRTTLDATTTGGFFSIVDFTEGQPSVVRTDPAYSSLGKQLAERTYEESGNYIISPFNLRLNTKYNSNGDIVPDYLKLEIDPGLAYVNGYRVETIGKLVSSVRRGTDTKIVRNQTITSTMGSYVFVNEFAGIFDPTSLQTVSLRSATAQAISTQISNGSSINGLSPPGSEIGTANIIGVEYDSGNPGSSSCVYRIYISNIVMNSGQNFKNVKALSVTDGTNEGYADTVLVGGNCVLQDPNLQSLTYPYNQKAVKTLFAFSANNTAQFDFKTISSITVSNTGIATVPVPSRAGGTNRLPYTPGDTLSNVEERDFILISKTAVSAVNASGSIIGSSGTNTIIGTSTTFTSAFAVGNLIKIANGTVSEIRRITAITNDTNISLANNLTNSWSGANVAYTLAVGDPIGTSVLPGSTISISNPATSATINLGKNFDTASSFAAEVLYNVRRTQAQPLLKKFYPSAFVKIDTASATLRNNGPWCLGLPDALRLKHVYVGSTYDTANPDLALSFTIENGQKDSFYGLSSLYRKAGASIPEGSKLLVEFDVFQTDATGGIGFYSVDSYPIDDTGVAANTILTQNIPVYVSDTSGVHDLRNSIDFRVQVTNTAVYTTDYSLANTNPPSTISFNNSILGYVPVPESSFDADLEYYVGRYDKVGIDERGNIKVLEGSASENPALPADIQNMMTIASILVPPFPSLSPAETISTKRYDLTTNITYYKNRRYTMKDISSLDKRIEKLEYYTSLSVLELSTKSLLIESSTGGNRFQHGILVDPFNGHDVCMVEASKISIDPTPSEARPKFNINQIDLKYNTSSGSTISENGRLISLNRTEIEGYIAQPFGSKIRNCAQDIIFTYTGGLTLYPDGDWSVDYTVNPAVVKNIDLYSNWQQLDNAWGTQWGTWEETSSSTVVNSRDRIGGTASTVQVGNQLITTTLDFVNQTTTTTSNQSRTGTDLNITKTDNTYDFGSYVTDINLQPYIKPQIVGFVARGMKPRAKLYAFFDDSEVTSYCKMVNGVPGNLQADENGLITGLFSIPGSTFHTGERIFKIVDVQNLIVGSATIETQASAKFFGTNLSYAKNNITLKTTEAQLSSKTQNGSQVLTNVDSRINIDRSVSVFNIPVRVDPILQTFSVNKEKADLAGIFVSSIDLYFYAKDSSKGITVEIREVFNGYPGPKIVPFSSKSLNPSEVYISTNGSVKTKFTFEAPVFLENNKDYAIAILPDSNNPNYVIWTAEQGGVDQLTNATVFKNSDIGVMFTSSDNSTWTPYQKEDIKFSLNRANFISQSSSVLLTNDDSEYLTSSSINGQFETDEIVYFANTTVTAAGNVAVTSTTVTNVSTTTLSAGDNIYIQSNTGVTSIVRNILSISNSTAFVINSVPTFTDNNCTIGKLMGNSVFSGFVKVIDYSNNNIIIGNSSSNSTVYVSSGSLIISSNSGASAIVSSVDNRSYNLINPKFSTSTPALTSIGLSFQGLSNTYSPDSTIYSLVFAQDNIFLDQERVVMSKSNEWRYYSGNKSLSVYADFESVSEKLSPIIDTIKCSVLGINNIINEDSNTAVTINFDSANGMFNIGDTVTDLVSSATGTVVYVYNVDQTTGTIIVDSPTGTFGAGANVKNSSNTSSNVVANSVTVDTSTTILETEKTPTSGLALAKYVSKKVVLADGQDAEDLKVYVAAYKPAGTDVYVFAKFWNSTDGDTFDNKHWTLLTTTNSLVSSKANQNDFIEYLYELPTTAPNDQTAYLNQNNSGIIRYVNRNGEIFDTYKSFSIKIVLLSNDSSVVPRLQDYRAIAVTT